VFGRVLEPLADARLGELEREKQRLRMERDLLKRAAAFFAKETETR
jgi:transposase-like protein